MKETLANEWFYEQQVLHIMFMYYDCYDEIKSNLYILMILNLNFVVIVILNILQINP